MAKNGRTSASFDILIVDRLAHMRAVLRDLVQGTFPGRVVMDTGSPHQALNLVQQARPRLVLLDVGLPGGNGIVLTTRIAAQSPRTRIIIVTDDPDRAYAERALSAGAFGVMLKQKIHTDLPQLIAAALGEPFLPAGS